MILAHQQRVVVEKAELDVKIQKLTEFTTMTRDDVSAEEVGRLQRQLAFMKAYSDVLQERIAAFAEPASLSPKDVAKAIIGRQNPLLVEFALGALVETVNEATGKKVDLTWILNAVEEFQKPKAKA